MSAPILALLWSQVVYGGLAATGLVAGWYFDQPRQYLVVHGAWHIFSAAAGSELAFAHAHATGLA